MGDVLANACRFARELESRGIGKDDKVLMCLGEMKRALSERWELRLWVTIDAC